MGFWGLALLGPPGAGKGTQAQKISAQFGYCHVSTGDMLRQKAALGDEQGRRLQVVLDAGELVPDDVVSRLIEARLRQPDCRVGYILDGFPRSRSQAAALEQVLGRHGLKSPLVIFITDHPISSGSIRSRL